MLFVDALRPRLTRGMISAEKKKLLFVFIASRAEEAVIGLVSHWSQVLIQAWFFSVCVCVSAGLLLAHSLICFSNVSSGLWQAAQQLEFEKASGGEQSFAESA